jgi:hypothetical protein
LPDRTGPFQAAFWENSTTAEQHCSRRVEGLMCCTSIRRRDCQLMGKAKLHNSRPLSTLGRAGCTSHLAHYGCGFRDDHQPNRCTPVETLGQDVSTEVAVDVLGLVTAGGRPDALACSRWGAAHAFCPGKQTPGKHQATGGDLQGRRASRDTHTWGAGFLSCFAVQPLWAWHGMAWQGCTFLCTSRAVYVGPKAQKHVAAGVTSPPSCHMVESDRCICLPCCLHRHQQLKGPEERGRQGQLDAGPHCQQACCRRCCTGSAAQGDRGVGGRVRDTHHQCLNLCKATTKDTWDMNSR